MCINIPQIKEKVKLIYKGIQNPYSQFPSSQLTHMCVFMMFCSLKH